MLLNCGVGEDSWESLGLQGDPTSPFWRRSALGFLWKEWCKSWNSSTLATSCEELTHWSFSFNTSPSNEHPGLISFRKDRLELLEVQGTLKSLIQHHSSKALILPCSAFFIVQLSHPYMTTGKTIALTRWDQSHHFMANRWGNNGNSDRLYFLGSKITGDGDCRNKIKRHLLLERKARPT